MWTAIKNFFRKLVGKPPVANAGPVPNKPR